jgi:molecular chaperone GrpE (heat shock protein)
LAVLQSKQGKWGWLVEKLQMKDASAAPAAEGAAAGERTELETLRGALNGLLADNEAIEKKNLELQEELTSLRLRNDLDKENAIKYALSEFAGDMIVVADNIRRAIEAIPKEQLGVIPGLNSLVEGVEVTERSLLTALTRYQVTRFDPLGEPFNPHLHEAKSAAGVPDVPSNTVVQVIHAGFMIGDRLLRPAGVVVSQIGAPAQPRDAAAADNRASPALPGAAAPGRYAQPVAVPGRKSSILHKPIISAAEGTPRDRVESDLDAVPASGQSRPPLPVQEAAYEEREISPAAGPAGAIEDPRERAKAVSRAFEAGNYAEAARLQEQNAAAVRRAETAAEGKPGDGTLDALLSLTWYQLLAGQYDTVIATADQAAAIRDDYITIDANRAHALMLKGAVDEARFLYDKHRGKETRNKKIWDHEILDDFAELEQGGVNHPLMDKIRNSWLEKD